MACGGIITIIDQWNSNCNAGVLVEQFPTHQPKQDEMSYSYCLQCTNCTTLMYINVINVTYTYIMLCTIQSTYFMIVYCLMAQPLSAYCNKKWIYILCMWNNTNSYEFVLIYERQTTKKLQSSKKWASPLSPGTRECVSLVPKTLRHRLYNLRHRLIQFYFCTGTIRTPAEVQDIRIHFHAISNPFFVVWGVCAKNIQISNLVGLKKWVIEFLAYDVSRLERYCTNILLARLTKVRCKTCERARPLSRLWDDGRTILRHIIFLNILLKLFLNLPLKLFLNLLLKLFLNMCLG